MKEHTIQKYLFGLVMIAASIITPISGASAMNIVPDNNLAFGEDIGFINFAPTLSGAIAPDAVEVTDTGIIGNAWSSNFGFIDFDTTNGGVSLQDRFIGQNCTSILSGEAWSPLLGWIDFDNVTIDSAGNFQGIADGVNSGRIFFQGQNIGVQTTRLPDCTGLSAQTPSGQQGGGRIFACRDPEALNFDVGFSDPDLCIFADDADQEISQEDTPRVIVDDRNPTPERDTDELTEIISNPRENVISEERITTPTIPRNTPQDVISPANNYTLKNNFDSCSVIQALTQSDDILGGAVFTDVSSFSFPDIISRFASAGIVSGFADGSFGPNRDITRAEFLKVVLQTHCLEYSGENTDTLAFVDVDSASWQARVISRAQGLGIVNGDTNERGQRVFRPNDIISKAEALKILLNMSEIQSLDPQKLTYLDIVTPWQESYVITAQSLGLFDPEKDNGQFNPDDGVQRENMLDLIYRLIKLYN